MLTTSQLEKELKLCIMNVLPNADFKKIHFIEGNNKSPEGIYVFAKDEYYHFLFTERGKIKFDKVLSTFHEVLQNILEIIIFDISMEYAKQHRVNGKDFRRILFTKEIELFSKFGEEFENEKKKDVRKILEENPYCDESSKDNDPCH